MHVCSRVRYGDSEPQHMPFCSILCSVALTCSAAAFTDTSFRYRECLAFGVTCAPILDPACCGWPRCRAICLISAQLPGFPPYNLQEFGQEFAAVPVGLTLVPYAKGHLPCDRRSNCAAYILFTPSHSFRLISNVHYSDSDEFPMNFECSYVPFSKIFLRAVDELRRTPSIRSSENPRSPRVVYKEG